MWQRREECRELSAENVAEYVCREKSADSVKVQRD
jgi:hypothetical protein